MGQKEKKKKEELLKEGKKKKKKKQEEASSGKKKKAQDKLRIKSREVQNQTETTESRNRAEREKKAREDRPEKQTGRPDKRESRPEERKNRPGKQTGNPEKRESRPENQKKMPEKPGNRTGMKKDRADQLRILAALSDAVRLDILDLLSDREWNASQLLEQVPVVQSTLSHHMKVLCECGLVTARREGRKTFYMRNETTIAEFAGWFLKSGQ